MTLAVGCDMTNAPFALNPVDTEATPARNAVARRRASMAALLTATAVGLGVSLALSFGVTGLVLFALPLPVPLALLWLSADVVRADELRPTKARAR